MTAGSTPITTLATLTNTAAPARCHNPLTEPHVSLLQREEILPNLDAVPSFPPYASVALFYAILIGGTVLDEAVLHHPSSPSRAAILDFCRNDQHGIHCARSLI